MNITNKSGTPIQVSVSRWGTGSIDWFPIAKGKKANWNRTDNRGFIMLVKIAGQEKSYFVNGYSEIEVHSSSYVTAEGSTVQDIDDRRAG